jgi:putative ABC transport system substrate-binding protein
VLSETESAAHKLRIQTRHVEARTRSELDHALAAISRAETDAVLVLGSTMLFYERARIAEGTRNKHIPTMCFLEEYVEAGCLMSYSASYRDLARRAASYVDRILRGANPAELPVEQPTKFDLTINLKTAKALGIAIPPEVRIRADRIIE